MKTWGFELLVGKLSQFLIHMHGENAWFWLNSVCIKSYKPYIVDVKSSCLTLLICTYWTQAVPTVDKARDDSGITQDIV